MKFRFLKTILLVLYPILIFTQNWTKLGKQSWPTNPNNITTTDYYWPPNGMGNIGNGQIMSIWVDPKDENHVLIGSFGGGIHESFNAISGGNSVVWSHKTANIPLSNVSKIIKKSGVIYASSGFYLNASNYNISNAKQDKYLYGLGVIKSTDGGNSWQIPIMPDITRGFNCTDFTPPNNDGVMFAISRTQVYKSNNFGNNWSNAGQALSTPRNMILEKISLNSINSNIVYVTGSFGTLGKVYKSIDGGNSWTNIDSNLTALVANFGSIQRSTITVDGSNNLYITISNGSRVIILKSTDWNNFSIVNDLYCASYNLKMNGNNFYLAGMDSLYKITGFNTVENINKISTGQWKMHVDARDLQFANTIDGKTYLYCGNDGGINISEDNGNTWRNITGNFVGHIINNMGYYSDPNDRVYDIGTQDDGWYRNEMTIPLSESQTFITRHYEGSVYTSPHNKRIYFESGDYSDNDGITRIGNCCTVRSMTEDPLDYQIGYFNGYTESAAPYKSFLYKANIINNTKINIFPQNALSTQTENNIGMKPAVALNSNKNILYPINHYSGTVSPINFLFYSNDGGNNWTDVGAKIKLADTNLPDPMSTPFNLISWVAIDEYQPNRMWVTFSTAGLSGQKIYESNDYGNTWTNISYNLSTLSNLNFPQNTPTNFPVNVVEYDENRDILFIGSDYGVFYLDRTVSPNQWKIYGTGLPKSIITNLFIDDYYNELVIGTLGNGVWSAPLSNCKDELIMTNSSWDGLTKNICGDLRIKHDITLTINHSNITARNIILEPNARIIWTDGQLYSSDLSKKSFIIGSRGSVVSLEGVSVNNYILNNFDTSTLVSKNNTFNTSELNIFKESFFDYFVDSQIILNNSKINFYSNYYYKTHLLTQNLINGNYYSNFDSINMSGYGAVFALDNIVMIQNENLIDANSPVVNYGNYIFKANDYIKCGNNVNNNMTNGFVNINSKAEMVAKNFITLENGTNIDGNSVFIHIDNTIPPTITAPYSKASNTVVDINKNQNPIESNASSDKIDFFPNPVKDYLNYKTSGKSKLGSIEIFNISGEKVFNREINSNEGTIDLTKLKTGVYILKYKLDGKISSKKIIKTGLTDGNNPIESN